MTHFATEGWRPRVTFGKRFKRRILKFRRVIWWCKALDFGHDFRKGGRTGLGLTNALRQCLRGESGNPQRFSQLYT